MNARNNNGHFKSGQSGNPRGRPTTKSSAIREKLMIDHDAIIEVLRQAALGGDMQACKLILERTCPALKPQALPVTVALPPEGDMTQIAETLIRAAASGRLAPDVASQMIGAIGQLARITQIKEHLHKSEDLEDESISGIRIRIINEKGEVTNPSNE